MPTVNTEAINGRLTVPGNITLLPLPSCAPELNPMENVWEYPRANEDPQRIRPIGHHDWARIKVLAGWNKFVREAMCRRAGRLHR
jgi:hypothetical protein